MNSKRVDSSDGGRLLCANDLNRGIHTERTLRNTKKSLVRSLIAKQLISNQDDGESVINGLLSIHGLHEDNFDFVRSIGINLKSRIADVSIDTNSNKNDKSVEGIIQEVVHPVKKLLGYDYLYRTMKAEFGKEEAQVLMGDMLDLSLGISDSTNILKPYCWAMDASKLVTMGRPFGQLKSSPCRRVVSYVANVTELIHYMSNHLAGAVAVGTFFLDIAHVALYNEGITMEKLKEDEGVNKYLRNCFQQFVHSVNHLSRSNTESPFVNISVFDREKLRALLSDDNFAWYFPKELGLNGHHESFIVEYIMKIQELFLSYFDQGDPMNDGMPYRFPVVTLNISKDKDGVVPDQEFLNHVCNLDIYRYNIFTSMGSKVASCCRLLSDTEMLDMASQSNSFGGSSVSLGSHRVVTINFNRLALECTGMLDFWVLLDLRVERAARILMAHKKLLKSLTNDGFQPLISNGWIQMNRLFSTFGVLGVYEADRTLKERFGFEEEDLVAMMLMRLNEKVEEFSKKYGIVGNIEQIPAESFAVRLADADRLLYGTKKVPYKLYANQFIPLWEEASIWDKMETDGRYNKLMTGGGIVHAQISEKLTPQQASKVIQFAIKSSCEHFALNAVYSKCEDDHTTFGKLDVCPVCGKQVVDHYTRVVGFFVPVSSWNKTRREWEFPKRVFVDDES